MPLVDEISVEVRAPRAEHGVAPLAQQEQTRAYEPHAFERELDGSLQQPLAVLDGNELVERRKQRVHHGRRSHDLRRRLVVAEE